MEKFCWVLIEPEKQKPVMVAMSRESAAMVAHYYPVGCKVALLAARSWRKWRGRAFYKAVAIMVDCLRGRENSYDVKYRITPGAYTVLKVMEPGKGV